MSDKQAGLFQLGNGDWIDLGDVRKIMAFARDNHGNPDRCAVVTADGRHHIIDCESYADAESQRDRIAALVNATRSNPS